MRRESYVVTNICYSDRSIHHYNFVPCINNSNFKNLDDAIEHMIIEIKELEEDNIFGIWIINGDGQDDEQINISELKVSSIKGKILEEGEITIKVEQIDPIDQTIYDVFKINCVDLL
jgi:hypothetical protein